MRRRRAASARGRCARWPAPAAGAETVALVGATVHPVSGPDVAERHGRHPRRQDRRASARASRSRPDAKVVDVAGRHVYPSLFPAVTVLGLVEISSVRATVDTTELGEINPQARADFAMNFDSELLPGRALGAGSSSPGSRRSAGSSPARSPR